MPEHPNSEQPMTHLNILRFESQRWLRQGAKEAAIVDTFGCTPTAFYGRLRQVVLAPSAEAMTTYPLVIRRTLDGMERQARLRGRRTGRPVEYGGTAPRPSNT